MTPEQLAYARSYYRKHRARRKANNRASYHRHKERRRQSERARQRQLYRRTRAARLAKNRATYRRNKAKWNPARLRWDRHNRSRVRRRSVVGLSDGYLLTLFRKCGIPHPTPDQLAHKRKTIRTLRARRSLRLLTYASRT